MTGPPLQGESGTFELQGRRLELLLWTLLLDIPELGEKEEPPPYWKEPDEESPVGSPSLLPPD
jgi:hypothetical protein